jgi:hypothetical protein
MTRSNLVSGSLLAGVCFAGGFLAGQVPPKVTVSAAHPNLVMAQKLIGQAYAYLVAAQKANDFDMQGHAVNAEKLLDQANSEIGLAGQAATVNGR